MTAGYPISTSAPTARIGWSSVNDRPIAVVEISVPPRPGHAVAVVLDMSDSCPGMRNELRKLPRLVELVPRVWPLWFYRLSEPAPLPQGSNLQIGDLQDGRISPADWMEHETSTRTARATGSFLGPVLEAIEDRRREHRGLDAVTILLFTDGELLDLAPIAVPSSLRIVAIAPAIEPEKLRHWNRVLPGVPLHTLADNALDDALRVDSYPFHGACQLAWHIEGQAVKAHCLDSVQGTTRPAESTAVSWNLLDSPAYLVFEISPEAFSRIRITCASQRNASLAVLLPSAGPPLPLAPSWLVAIDAAIAGQPSEQMEIVLDMAAGSEGFDRLWEALRSASELAAQRAKWLDSDGRLVVFSDLAFENRLLVDRARPKYDAMLCLLRGDPKKPPNEESRAVLVALQRARHPALCWRPDSPPAFGTPVCPIEIDYDRENDCWIIKYGDAIHELELNGSEDLSCPSGRRA